LEAYFATLTRPEPLNTSSPEPLDALFLSGLPDDGLAIVKEANNRHSLYLSGSSNLYDYLRHPLLRGRDVLLNTYLPEEIKLGNTRLLVNCVSDPDSHKKALSIVQHFERTLDLPVFNSSVDIEKTRRDRVWQILKDLPGLIVPRTEMVQAAHPDDLLAQAAALGLQYPLLVRRPGHHGGKSLIKLDAPDALRDLDVFAFDGTPFFLAEYVDYADSQDVYRKVRLAVVNGRPFIRHSLANDSWMVHASAREGKLMQQARFQQEEEALIAAFETDIRPWVEPITQKIQQLIPLQYFGMDVCIRPDNTLLLFELNVVMNMLAEIPKPMPPAMRTQYEMIKTALLRALFETVSAGRANG
jgi:glutathione synthase/RimK-type ligase-like ATP-grasp enzyme